MRFLSAGLGVSFLRLERFCAMQGASAIDVVRTAGPSLRNMTRLAKAVDTFGFHLLVLCVVLAPIPFGSSSALAAGCLGFLLSICLLASTLVPVPGRRVRRLYGAMLILGVIVVLWCLIQAMPLLSPMANPIWERARPLVEVGAGTISASRHQPLHSAGYVLLPLAGFLCALVYVRDGDRYTTFLHLLLGVGVVFTLAAIAQHMIFPKTLVWAPKRHYADTFTGTFVNPNNAATYYGLLLLLSVSVALRQLEKIGPELVLAGGSHRTANRRRREGLLALYAAIALVFASALLLTKSRAGIICSAIGVASLIAAYLLSMLRRRTTLSKAVLLTALALLAAAAWFAVASGYLQRRLWLEGFVDEGRLCAYRATWQATKDAFWTGTGFGTFQDIYPSYRSADCGVYGYWEMAHNVFLEGWLGLGVVFLLCTICVYALLLKTYAQGLRDRDGFRFVPLSCLGLLIIVTLHSLVDFSLQIPAVALVVAAVLGAGAAVSLERAPVSRVPRTDRRDGQRAAAASVATAPHYPVKQVPH
jgi:O-antigen ligase